LTQQNYTNSNYFEKRHYNAILSICSTPDQKYILTGGSDGIINVWAVFEKNTPKYVLHIGDVFSPAISGLSILEYNRNRIIIICGNIKGIIKGYSIPLKKFKIFKTTKPELLEINYLNSNNRFGVFDISTKMNVNIIAVGYLDSIIFYEYSIKGKIHLRQLGEKKLDNEHFSYFTAQAFSRKRPYFAAGSSKGKIMILNHFNFQKAPMEINLDGCSEITAIDFHPSKNQLLVAGRDNNLFQLNISEIDRPNIRITKVNINIEHNGALAVSHSLDGKRIFIGTTDNLIDIYINNTKTKAFQFYNSLNLVGHGRQIFVIHPLKNNVILFGDNEGNISYNKIFNTPFLSSIDPLSFKNNIQCMIFHGFCKNKQEKLLLKTFVAGDESGNIYLWKDIPLDKIQPAKPIYTPEISGNISDISISLTGRQLAYCTTNGIIGCFELFSQNPSKTLRILYTNNIYKFIHFNKDLTQLVAGNAKTIDVFNIENDTIILKDKLIKEDTSITCFAIDPSKKNIVYATENKRINILNNKCIDFHSVVHSLAFSPDGISLAVGDHEGHLYVIKFNDFSKLNHNKVLKGKHSGRVTQIAFNPKDPKQLVSSGADKAIIVWDLTNKEMIGKQKNAHHGHLTNIVFHPEGQVLLSSGKDKEIHFWDMCLDRWQKNAEELKHISF